MDKFQKWVLYITHTSSCFNINFLPTDGLLDELPEGHNSLINTLIRQLIEFIRHVITDGSPALNIPPLDPLEFDHFHLEIPAGLIK